MRARTPARANKASMLKSLRTGIPSSPSSRPGL
jgi:hypothetical protein